MTLWQRLVGDRPITTRLVLAVAGTMALVLLLTGAFVFSRVQFALDRQLDQDLAAYHHVVLRALTRGENPPGNTPGETFQVYDHAGRLLEGNAARRLVGVRTVAGLHAGQTLRRDEGKVLPASDDPVRVVVSRVQTPDGARVIASALSRRNHDEALRELFLQLVLAGLATLLAASLVGYATARGALRPVERYRRAAAGAESADQQALLPVAAHRNDEISRLGHTFNALLERIRQSNERERQFLADASHELRSPLALMRTELEMALLRPRGEEETKAALTSLREQVERLIALSDALLDLEELRATQQLTHEPLRLGPLVDEVAARWVEPARRAGREVRTAVPGGATIEGNRHWLALALDNLLGNALRHGRGAVTLEVWQVPEATRLTVRDEGAGFPDGFVDKAFDRFARADESRSTPGTGLGLALVRAVAEAHDGRAEIDGAAVTVVLPTSGAPTRVSAAGSGHRASG